MAQFHSYLAFVALTGCTVNGKPFNPFGGSSAPSGSAPASPETQSNESGWGGAVKPAAVEQPTKFVPRCPNGKRYFLGAPEQYPGHGVQSVAIADVNGDRIADIVTGNPYGDKPARPHDSYIGVMLNKGGGAFAAMARFPVGGDSSKGLMGEAARIALGDLDGDGKPDMVFSSPGIGGTDPQYVLNNGDGTFGEPVSLHGRNVAGNALVADFNGDKRLDIVIENYLWLNSGKGKFTAKLAFNDTWDRGADAAADFDGDGSIDIASHEGGAKIYLNDGNAHFTKGAVVALDNTKELRSGDFNGDGKPDLAVLGSSLAILVNKGDGTFAPPVYYKFPASFDMVYWITVADLNGDRKADVVVGDAYNGVAVFINTGDGRFGAPIALPAGKPHQIAAADLDGSGVASLVVVDASLSSDESKSNVYVLRASCR